MQNKTFSLANIIYYFYKNTFSECATYFFLIEYQPTVDKTSTFLKRFPKVFLNIFSLYK